MAPDQASAIREPAAADARTAQEETRAELEDLAKLLDRDEDAWVATRQLERLSEEINALVRETRRVGEQARVEVSATLLAAHTVPPEFAGRADDYVTLICEAPRIGPHRQAMVEAIARITGVEPGRVSVKATTTEGLGFTGRREGIAAQAVATIEMPRT